MTGCCGKNRLSAAANATSFEATFSVKGSGLEGRGVRRWEPSMSLIHRRIANTRGQVMTIAAAVRGNEHAQDEPVC
jgi:hypothetical protein